MAGVSEVQQLVDNHVVLEGLVSLDQFIRERHWLVKVQAESALLVRVQDPIRRVSRMSQSISVIRYLTCESQLF